MKYQVSCLMKFDNESDRNLVFNYLQSKKAVAVQDQPSFIEKHTCLHDENKTCIDEVKDGWGGET